MNTTICVTCQSTKAPLKCGICEGAICKGCAQFVEDQFTFLSVVPDDLKHSTFCGSCFSEKVQEPLAAYQETMSRAREIAVYFKDQSKETRLFRRSKDVFKVVNCADRDETVMRLAFQAAQKGYNALIDVELNSQKVRDHAYQTSRWSGSGVGVLLDARKIR